MRPHLAGISQSRWMAIPSLAAGLLFAGEASGLGSPWLAPGAVAVLVGLALSARWWSSPPPLLPLPEIREVMRPEPGHDHGATHCLPGGIQVEVVHHGGQVMLRASRDGRPLEPEEHELLLQAYMEAPTGSRPG